MERDGGTWTSLVEGSHCTVPQDYTDSALLYQPVSLAGKWNYIYNKLSTTPQPPLPKLVKESLTTWITSSASKPIPLLSKPEAPGNLLAFDAPKHDFQPSSSYWPPMQLISPLQCLPGNELQLDSRWSWNTRTKLWASTMVIEAEFHIISWNLSIPALN